MAAGEEQPPRTMPRIAIDASPAARARRTGTERYALELLRALINANRDYRLTLYFRGAAPADLLPDSPLVERVALPDSRLWTHTRLAAALWRRRPALTFAPAHTLPLAFPGPAIATVHDLGYRHFPAAHPPGQRRYLDWSTRHSARRANIALCDSRATAADLARFYGVDEAKLRVVYPGAGVVNALPTMAEIAAAREKHGLPERYFLHVGTLQPRKNLAMLARAFARWRQTRPAGDDCVLALAGGAGWLYEETQAALVGEGLRLLGYVAETELAALYAGARALLFPSLHEGFGFPALEAMGYGAPVLASDRASLPEVVGAAGLLLDARDERAWAAAIARIDEDEALRRQLIAAGYEQARNFRWQDTALSTLAAFSDALR